MSNVNHLILIILNLIFVFLLSGPNTYEDAAAYIQLKFESLNRY